MQSCPSHSGSATIMVICHGAPNIAPSKTFRRSLPVAQHLYCDILFSQRVTRVQRPCLWTVIDLIPILSSTRAPRKPTVSDHVQTSSGACPCTFNLDQSPAYEAGTLQAKCWPPEKLEAASPTESKRASLYCDSLSEHRHLHPKHIHTSAPSVKRSRSIARLSRTTPTVGTNPLRYRQRGMKATVPDVWTMRDLATLPCLPPNISGRSTRSSHT
jgi:hypothetical protein